MEPWPQGAVRRLRRRQLRLPLGGDVRHPVPVLHLPPALQAGDGRQPADPRRHRLDDGLAGLPAGQEHRQTRETPRHETQPRPDHRPAWSPPSCWSSPSCPMPISRIRGLAVVQAHPDASTQIVLKKSAILVRLKVQPGETVTPRPGAGRVPRHRPRGEARRRAAPSATAPQEYLQRLEEQQRLARSTPARRNRIEDDMAQTTSKRDTRPERDRRAASASSKRNWSSRPRSTAIIGQGPKVEDIGKMIEGAPRAAAGRRRCSRSTRPSKLRVCLPLVTSEYNQLSENLERPPRRGRQDRQAARAARHAARPRPGRPRPGRGGSPGSTSRRRSSSRSRCRAGPAAPCPSTRPRASRPAWCRRRSTTSCTSTSWTRTRPSPSAAWPR